MIIKSTVHKWLLLYESKSAVMSPSHTQSVLGAFTPSVKHLDSGTQSSEAPILTTGVCWSLDDVFICTKNVVMVTLCSFSLFKVWHMITAGDYHMNRKIRQGSGWTWVVSLGCRLFVTSPVRGLFLFVLFLRPSLWISVLTRRLYCGGSTASWHVYEHVVVICFF